ncbi:MAG: hypothetical protein M1825_006051 [Sarcosagium campestre]|nr:MAG: hypothetical protein M1825_006051 [Sarcosagium campestre]
MVLLNPKNWHWVSKDASTWTRSYLEDNLLGLSAQESATNVKLDNVLSMEGDVDVSQRKGKVITLFDIKLQLEYSGKTADGEDVGGTVTIPEVAHDTAEDEYVFDVDIYSDVSSKQPVKDLLRKSIVPQLRQKLAQLGPALIEEHGKDLQHGPESTSTSGVSTPVNTATSTGKSLPTTKATPTSISSTTSGKTSVVNTTTVNDTEEFRTTAEELFLTFTDSHRLAAFTRAPPKLFEGAKVGGKFEIFDGNVSGDFVELERPTKIVQRWRLGQWPTGHYSQLEIKFDQNDQDSVTVMRVKWDGVPVGQEEVTKRNWREYYVRSIKTTFG